MVQRVRRLRASALLLAAAIGMGMIVTSCGSDSDSSARDAAHPPTSLHDHGDSPLTTLGPDGAEPAKKDEHGTMSFPWEPMSEEESAQLIGQLDEAASAAARYPLLRDATRAGYVVANDTPNSGAHAIKWSLMDDRFEVAEPEMLLFDGVNPGARLIGLSYHVVTDADTPPEGFTGPNDHWHTHRQMCFDGDGWLLGADVEPADCDSRGGVARAADGFMLHVWVVPGWDNPAGIFATVNPRYVVADDR